MCIFAILLFLHWKLEWLILQCTTLGVQLPPSKLDSYVSCVIICFVLQDHHSSGFQVQQAVNGNHDLDVQFAGISLSEALVCLMLLITDGLIII